MLPNGEILKAVAAEVLPAMPEGSVHLDCSTVDVESARAVAAQAAASGIGCGDAPVSGGSGGAAAGTLTFMAGGSADAFAAALPLFEIMGQKAVHCGDAGAGQAAKICNNMLLAITMIGTCEAFALADKLGLDAQTFYDISSKASGQSWSMTSYCPVPGVGPESPADRGYAPGFAAAMMLKDLKLAKEAASAADAATPLGALSEALYQAYSLQGNSGKDFSGIINLLSGKSI